MLQSIKFTKRQCNTVKIQHFWSWLVYEIVNLYYNVSEKQLPSYVLNNSMKNQPTLISFGKQHPKETRHWKVQICLPHVFLRHTIHLPVYHEPECHYADSSPCRRWWRCQLTPDWYRDHRRVLTAETQTASTQCLNIDTNQLAQDDTVTTFITTAST